MRKWGPLALIFLAGLLFGMSFGWWGRAHREPGKRLEFFARKLDLNNDQKQKVGMILDEKRAQIRALRQSTKEDIRKILNPEQLKKYEALEARRDKRRTKKNGPPHP